MLLLLLGESAAVVFKLRGVLFARALLLLFQSEGVLDLPKILAASELLATFLLEVLLRIGDLSCEDSDLSLQAEIFCFRHRYHGNGRAGCGREAEEEKGNSDATEFKSDWG